MPTPPVTAADLIALVRKSQVVDSNDLDEFLKRPEPLPDAAKPLAQEMIKAGLITKFHAAHLLVGKSRGFLMGQYRILQQIGAGGMGVIFLGEHIGMKRKVAIKVLPHSRAMDRESLERFYREARVVAALDHPNIVRAHDAARSPNDVHFLVMEYIEGESLEEIMRKKGPLPVLDAVNYIAQAAAGLAHAHERGLVHRDIKPANLLLDKEGTIKLLDMGLARFFDDPDDALTRELADGVVIGTADYIAPEQAVNSHDVDIRADIYSLGMTFYALLQGTAPFAESSVTQKLLAHHMKDPTPIHQLRGDVPEELSDVIRTMMAKQVDDRYATPAELLQALAPWARPRYAPAPVTMPMRPAPQRKPGASKTALPPTRPPAPSGKLPSPVFSATRKRWLIPAAISAFVLIAGGIWLATRPPKPNLSDPIVRNIQGEQPVRKAPQPEPASVFSGSEGPVEQAAFIPGSGQLASVGHDGFVRIWDLQTGMEVAGSPMKGQRARSISISADGKHALQCGFTKNVLLWDLEKRALIKTFPDALSEVKCAALLADGKRYAAGCRDGVVLLCQLSDGKVVNRLLGHENEVFAIETAPDGRHLLTASEDKTVRLWDTDTGAQMRHLTGHEGGVHGLALHWESRIAVSGSADKSARIWDLESGRLLQTLRGHNAPIPTVTISPDSTRVLTGGQDFNGMLWEVATGRQLGKCTGHTDNVWGAKFAADGMHAVTASKDGTLRSWNLPTLPAPVESKEGELRKYAAGDPQVERVALSPSGRTVMCPTRGDVVRLWDVETGALVRDLKGHKGIVWFASFNPAGTLAVTAGADGTIRVWDIATGNEVNKTTTPKDEAWTAVFHPDGQSVFYGSKEGAGRLWNINTGRVTRTFTGHKNNINSAAFSPDGKRLFTAGWDGTVRGWEVATGDEKFKHQREGGRFAAVAASPDGKTILAGGDKGVLVVLNAENGEVIRELKGHAGNVWVTQYSPDGRYLLAGGTDKQLHFWNAADGKLLRTIEGHTGSIPGAAFTPDGRRLISCSQDKTARLWGLPRFEAE